MLDLRFGRNDFRHHPVSACEEDFLSVFDVAHDIAAASSTQNEDHGF